MAERRDEETEASGQAAGSWRERKALRALERCRPALLDALDTILGVVRDGRLYTREMLDDQLDRYRNHFENSLYEALLTPLVRSVVASTAPD